MRIWGGATRREERAMRLGTRTGLIRQNRESVHVIAKAPVGKSLFAPGVDDRKTYGFEKKPAVKAA
jgi:hypothetical protein